ncbi:MAG: hypothetical protein WAM44_11145, partial [Chthoniobacterales bacterium]
SNQFRSWVLESRSQEGGAYGPGELSDGRRLLGVATAPNAPIHRFGYNYGAPDAGDLPCAHPPSS